jgi:class 3 adenylate cyclase
LGRLSSSHFRRLIGISRLTKTTGDAILLTHQTVDALVSPPSGLMDRGSHHLKGKSAAVQVFGLELAVTPID